ncbi:uncharacterized protein H6S33_009192 [Morchella sextelata]|uniref:uncharacterized protein n=1 Tax=Morchella sextelata TaxID=1174677 RepID=UPI001D037085|nr:uncharacterized protein H6S33_009192 [Morchella sextelata]KAH0612812.1 hypothetical protein H6S33_009192 [Morchella sextelata]
MLTERKMQLYFDSDPRTTDAAVKDLGKVDLSFFPPTSEGEGGPYGLRRSIYFSGPASAYSIAEKQNNATSKLKDASCTPYQEIQALKTPVIRPYLASPSHQPARERA